MRLQVRKNSSDYLDFYPSDNTLPSSTATLTITDADGNNIEGLTYPLTVNRDTVNSTVSTQAVEGDKTLLVDVITGVIRGETYLLTLPNGVTKQVRVNGVSANQILIDEPLSFVVPVGSVIQGIKYSQALNTTVTANVKRRVRAKWTYTVNSRAKTVSQEFDIVITPFQIDISERDIENLDHNFGEVTSGSDKWRSLIPGCVRDLGRWLESRKIYLDLIKDTGLFKDCVSACILARFYGAQAGKESQILASSWFKLYESYRVQVADSPLWYDQNDNDLYETEPEDIEGNALPSESGLPAGFMGVG